MKAVHFAILSITVLVAVPTLGAGESYPRPNLLLDPSELAKSKVAERFVILDVRSEEAYQKAHIPGARRVDHDSWKSAFSGGTDAKGWGRRIGALGIDKDTSVVVYDDIDMKDAARIWWLLRFWGVSDVRLLNGGWKSWTAMKLPTSDQPTTLTKQVDFKAHPLNKRFTDKNQILDLLKGGKLQIVDTRSFGEFCGLEPGKNRHGGAIPGAKHLEWSDLIDHETHRFKSAVEIRTLLAKAGIDLKRPTATHCQSGGRASVMAFGLELMGAKDVRNYYRGWSEWGNAEGVPIEQREAKPKK